MFLSCKGNRTTITVPTNKSLGKISFASSIERNRIEEDCLVSLRSTMRYSLRQCPGPSDCSLKVFYEGFTGNKAVWVDGLDPKTTNLANLKDIASKLGYKVSGTNFAYRSPATQGLVNINTDEDVKKMIKELPVISRDLEVRVTGVREKEKPEETPTILFWNCRTLGRSATDMLKVLKAIYEPSIIFLIETRMSSHVIKSAASKMGFENVYQFSSTIGTADKPNCVGLAMLFKTDINVEYLNKTENYLDFVINVSPTGKKWRLTGFYGHPTLKSRSWEWLRKLKKINDLPWIIFGDFNEILSTDEKIGGRPKKEDDKWKDFEKVVHECGLDSLPFEGYKFTWRRGKIMQRLDRALVTPEWKDKIFPAYRMVHLDLMDGGVSDHIPIIIQTDGQKHKRENIAALRIAMDEVFLFAKRLQDEYFAMEGLRTMSNIVNKVQLKNPNYFEIARTIAPKVIHATHIAVHDKATNMVKYDRLVSLKTRANLSLVLWNCLVLAKPSSDDDFKVPPDCPRAWCTQIINKNEVNLSENLAQACELLSLIPVGGRITRQAIIDKRRDEQVKSLITWLKDSFKQDDHKHFVISIGDAEYRSKTIELKESALVVGQSVILYGIMISLIREGSIAPRGTITDLQKKLNIKIKDYVPWNILDKEKRIEVAWLLKKPLQYLLKTLEWQVADSSDYEVDITAFLRLLKKLEDIRLEAERKAMMWLKLEPLISELRKRGSVQIDKLEDLVKDSVIVDRVTVPYQIKLLIDMKILRSDVNRVLEFEEANKSSQLIAEGLKQAVAVALKSIQNSTSKKPMKYQTYLNKIIRAYKKTRS